MKMKNKNTIHLLKDIICFDISDMLSKVEELSKQFLT